MGGLITIVLYVVFGILLINVFYLFLFSLAGKLGKVKKCDHCDNHSEMVVLIPAYKEDGVIISTVREALKQNYPQEMYKIVVIADSLQDDTLVQLRKFPIEVMEVNFEKSSKAKALKEAILRLEKEYEGLVILDADNIMAKDFLKKISSELKSGKKAVQGHRVAKNENTHMALLDAASEEINNHIFRKGHSVLGFSSALIGSGMAFNYSYFKSMIPHINSMGEDKEMELVLLKNKIRIHYQDEAMVYDEKVQDLSVFRNQRKRWISAQVYFFSKYFIPAWGDLFRERNWDYFNKAFQTVLIPRLMLLGFTSLFFLLSLFHPVSMPSEFASGTVLFGCILTLGLALPARLYNRRLIKAVFMLPLVFGEMVLILFRLKNSKNTFIHTPHTIVVEPPAEGH